MTRWNSKRDCDRYRLLLYQRQRRINIQRAFQSLFRHKSELIIVSFIFIDT